jgi:ribonuclease Y
MVIAMVADSGIQLVHIAIGAGGFMVGIVAGWVILRTISSGTVRSARADATRQLEEAATKAEAMISKAELDAERLARQRREEADAEIVEARGELKKDQSRMERREDLIDSKLTTIATREEKIEAAEDRVTTRQEAVAEAERDVEKERGRIVHRLAEVAGLSLEEAKVQVLQEVREQSAMEAAELTQEILNVAETQARAKGQEITLMSIQRYASTHVADSTVRSVKIPSDDLKGRIIGREGRNIRSLERATGADILVDDTPGVIAVSCFDPIRRAIAGEALSKLVADGRVHPSRIEEIVEQVRGEITDRIIKEGNDAVMEANLRGVNPKIIEAMGRLHFRTSYGQNVLRHSMEVAYLSQMIADQLGLDGRLARRCGFFHDIGKSMDHEMEGGHPAIGMEFVRKHGEKDEAVLNAVGGHHGDIPATTPYTPIVMAADAISGARPGARRESLEHYIQRLEQLESIATALENVTEAHAIQAGREIRVIVDAKNADDAEAFVIARKIAEQVEAEMTFPGEIKVTVLREVRAQAIAR